MKPVDTKGKNVVPIRSHDVVPIEGTIGREQQRMVQAYKALIPFLRRTAERVLTKAGKPSRSPGYFAVTWCEYEQEPGITSGKHMKGKRWACKTCFNFAEPIWTDNPEKCPSTDEALHEYAEWIGKEVNKRKPWKRRMMDA